MANTKHTLIIADLDDFEAEHIASILCDYRPDMLAKRIDAMAAGDQGRIEWIDKHLDWHGKILDKISWQKK